MDGINDIVKVAVDAYHGSVQQFSVGTSQSMLRDALIEANGGSAMLNYKNIRDGKCNGLFTLIEEILSRTVVEGVQSNDFFNAFVDFRNVPLGDQNIFVVEDMNDLFTVSDLADGTQSVRRQRLGGRKSVPIETSMKFVRIYEELNNVLTGRVDFNYMIDKVSKSFSSKLLDSIFAAWSGVTADQLGGTTYIPVAGSYDEDELMDLISHVEAASGGKTATVIGTKKAIRNLAPSIQSTDANNDMYHTGTYGTFYGTPVMSIPQRHKVNSTEFVMPDNILTVVAGDDKPIKCVNEGDPTIVMGDPMQNADFTQEYAYGERYGISIVTAGGNGGIGRYEIA